MGWGMNLKAKGPGKVMEKNFHLAIWLYHNIIQKTAVKRLIPQVTADEGVNPRR